jgi:tyrosine decarboxylase
MLDWFAKALDLPNVFLSRNSNPKSKGGGALQGSASDAIFACMCSARHQAIKKLKGDDKSKPDSYYLPKLVAYASSEAHSSVQKAAIMNLVEFRTIKPDKNDSMRGEALEKAIAEDVKAGLTPFFVCATVGTTSQCAIDHLTEVGEVCKKYPTAWFHVDGAYGGNTFILPEMNKFKAGIELADSLEINPNKLLLTNFDTTCMFLKDCAVFVEAFIIDPLYLQHPHESSFLDLRHFGIPLSRRFRSLKLFFMFRMYGLEEFQAYVRQVIKMGVYFEKLVKQDDRFEILNKPRLGLVCIRLK